MKNTRTRKFYDLPKLISVLKLFSDAVLARISIECAWDDNMLDYYMKYSHQISESDRKKINFIVKDQLSYLSTSPPQMFLSETLGELAKKVPS